jgi:hypothetical protein
MRDLTRKEYQQLPIQLLARQALVTTAIVGDTIDFHKPPATLICMEVKYINAVSRIVSTRVLLIEFGQDMVQRK